MATEFVDAAVLEQMNPKSLRTFVSQLPALSRISSPNKQQSAMRQLARSLLATQEEDAKPGYVAEPVADRIEFVLPDAITQEKFEQHKKIYGINTAMLNKIMRVLMKVQMEERGVDKE